jgi:hypothetical protein
MLESTYRRLPVGDRLLVAFRHHVVKSYESAGRDADDAGRDLSWFLAHKSRAVDSYVGQQGLKSGDNNFALLSTLTSALKKVAKPSTNIVDAEYDSSQKLERRLNWLLGISIPIATHAQWEQSLLFGALQA